MPHLDAAHNLARWLLHDPAAAEDAVQEAFLRAWKGFPGFRGGDGRAWVLAIVRNACYSWIGQRGARAAAVEFDERLHSPESQEPEPERQRARAEVCQTVGEAIAALPLEFREALVLREFAGCSYKEISTLAQVPVGTVMSRLARARAKLAELLGAKREVEA